MYRKHLFKIPDNLIYLDGNSLGPLLKTVVPRLENVIKDEWGTKLIKSWNESKWIDQPKKVGNLIARILNAPKNTISVGDTLSIKLFQALAAAIDLKKNRNVILTDTGNFPSDIYIAKGFVDNHKRNIKLKIVPPEAILKEINEDVAIVMLTHVNYKTGKMYDMREITKICHKNKSIIIWDLAHSAGAVPVDLENSNCEFAVGCTYKYLNGGPGAPAYIYIRNDLIEKSSTILQGWMSHTNPFDFSLNFVATKTIDLMRIGTPPVIQMSILEESLKLWEDVNVNDLRINSIELSELLIRKVKKKCPEIKLLSPTNPNLRGSHVSFLSENGYAIIQTMINKNIIGDFRDPNVMRFGITPLYINEDDILETVDVLEKIVKTKSWNKEKFLKKKYVT